MAHPYEIPLWAVLPRRAEVSNLVCVATPSGSHIGFSSLRMEPQFMVLGHSAGTLAALWLAAGDVSGQPSLVRKDRGGSEAIQDVPPAVLAAALRAEGQILVAPQCK